MLILQGPKKSRVHTIGYSADGSTIAATYGRGTVAWLWDLARARVRCRLSGHIIRIRAFAFSPDGRLMASADNWGTVVLWNLADCSRHVTVTPICTTALTFSHDSRWLVGNGKRPYIWDVESGRELDSFEPTISSDFHYTRTVAMAPDRRMIAWGRNREPFVLACDLDTGKQGPPMPTVSEPTALAFRPDGQDMAALTHRPVTIFDLETFKERLHFTVPTGILWRMAYAPDGRTLVTVSTNRSICFWDLDTGQPRRTFDWNLGPVWSVAFAPDGLTVAAGGANGRIIVWDVDE